MNRFARASVPLVALLALAASGPSFVQDEDDEEEPPPVKELMGTLNKGPDSLTPKLGRALEPEDPDWAAIAKLVGQFVEATEHLCENDPPRGDAESWKKLTRLYHEEAQTLQRASKAKSKDAALASHAKLRRACTACHLKHKP